MLIVYNFGNTGEFARQKTILGLKILLTATIVCQWHYIINVINEMATCLKIKVFSITNKNVDLNKHLLNEETKDDEGNIASSPI